MVLISHQTSLDHTSHSFETVDIINKRVTTRGAQIPAARLLW